MLVEEFKRCVLDDVKIFLGERSVDDGYQMIMLADEYALTHKKRNPGVGHATQLTHAHSPKNKFNFGGSSKQDRFGRLNFFSRKNTQSDEDP